MVDPVADFEADSEWDDFEDDSPRLPKRSKRNSRGKSNAREKNTESVQSASVPKPLLIGLISTAVILGATGGWFGIRAIIDAGNSARAAAARPTVLEPFHHELGMFTIDGPKEWDTRFGGGQGGIPPWVIFEHPRDSSIKVSIRSSISGSAIGDITGAVDSMTGGGDIEELQPVHAVHLFQKEKIAVDYNSYEETEPEVLQTKGYGEGRICEFTASAGFSSECGVRATLLDVQYQYNIICKCPKDKLKVYRPIFQRIIKSIRK